MSGSEKLKTTLYETRIPVLGAQVLLGFQLRGAFQDGFDDLPAGSTFLVAMRLMLMTLVLALWIAPAIHHRVADVGNATARIFGAISAFMSCPPPWFPLPLGINVFIVIDGQCCSGGHGRPCGHGNRPLVWVRYWFGIELLALRNKEQIARRNKGGTAMEAKHENVPLPPKIDQMLTEARVILAGAQALLRVPAHRTAVLRGQGAHPFYAHEHRLLPWLGLRHWLVTTMQENGSEMRMTGRIRAAPPPFRAN
jgi:hypothetical protein